MLYHELSNTIKNQADLLIAKKKLNEVFSEFGEIVYTGSYAFDLMTWRDIDLQLKTYPGKTNKQVISSIFSRMIQDQDIIHMEYTESSKTRSPKMPEGSYLQIQIQDAKYVWKIDLWILKAEDFNQNKKFISIMKDKLDNNQNTRDLILRLKFEFMKGNYRPPKMASYFLYQAILFENIKDPELIKDYLKSHDIKI